VTSGQAGGCDGGSKAPRENESFCFVLHRSAFVFLRRLRFLAEIYFLASPQPWGIRLCRPCGCAFGVWEIAV
jgi:hypothetical protein